MKVKFLTDVQSAIGSFHTDEVHDIADDYVRNNWIENNLCTEDKPRRVKKNAD